MCLPVENTYRTSKGSLRSEFTAMDLSPSTAGSALLKDCDMSHQHQCHQYQVAALSASA